MAETNFPNPQQVECPRCRTRRSLSLHRIMASDAQECPRCWSKDGVEVPMAIYPSMLDPHVVNRLSGGTD
jgi:hypothetical protein